MNSWRRFARFNAVGLMGIGVQLATLWLLTAVAHLAYLPATVLAVTSAVVHNFLWHLHWTWADRAPRGSAVPAAFARFALANGAVSLAGNIVVMAALVGGAGLHPMPANVIAIAVCGLLNFHLGDWLVFPRRAQSPVTERRLPMQVSRRPSLLVRDWPRRSTGWR